MPTIDEFIDRLTIKPKKDIEPYFNKIKEFSVDATNHKGCFNCGDTINQKALMSEPWSGVQWCWRCSSLNVIYYQDRMSGADTDVVRCYAEKEKEEGK